MKLSEAVRILDGGIVIVVEFAMDSPLEGTRFELPVPGRIPAEMWARRGAAAAACRRSPPHFRHPADPRGRATRGETFRPPRRPDARDQGTAGFRQQRRSRS